MEPALANSRRSVGNKTTVRVPMLPQMSFASERAGDTSESIDLDRKMWQKAAVLWASFNTG